MAAAAADARRQMTVGEQRVWAAVVVDESKVEGGGLSAVLEAAELALNLQYQHSHHIRYDMQYL